MSADRVSSEELLTKRIQDLERQVRELQQRAMVMPFVNDRMSSVMPTNIYAFNDDRLLIRSPDGHHFELRGMYNPHIPVFSADPSSSYPGSVWVLASNGHLRIRTDTTILDYTPNNPGAVSARWEFVNSTNPLPSQGSIPTTRQTIYNATWSGSYDGGNARRVDTEHMYFGNDGDSFGQQKSLIGFDYLTMADDLADATITSVELYLAVMDQPYVDNGTIRIGLHNNTSRPETYTNVYKQFTNALPFAKIEAGWRQITNEFATGVVLGVCKGILIDQLTAAQEFYGYAAGAAESSLPKVRITYVR